MRKDEVDRVLSKDTAIVPSSGFVSAVMDAVRSEASAPPPIPFPWKLVVPGLLICGGLLLWLLWGSFRLPERPASTSTLASSLNSIVSAATGSIETYGAAWVILSVAVTLLAIRWSMRLARGR